MNEGARPTILWAFILTAYRTRIGAASTPAYTLLQRIESNYGKISP